MSMKTKSGIIDECPLNAVQMRSVMGFVHALISSLLTLVDAREKGEGRKESRMRCSSSVDLTDLVQFLLDNLDSLSDCLIGNGQGRMTGVFGAAGICQSFFKNAVHQVIVLGAFARAHELGDVVLEIGSPSRSL
jgi:hypothetical protein